MRLALLLQYFVFKDCSKAVLILSIIFAIMFYLCLYFVVVSVSCSFVITCWKTAELLAPLCVIFIGGGGVVFSSMASQAKCGT